jgi:3-oxoacyl-[acyl-carrier-protein] synthase-3
VTSFPLTFAGLGAGIPQRILTNDELAERIDTSDEWIRGRTGISSRRILEEGKAMSDLGTEAGRGALQSSGFEPESIDLVLVATMTPDTYMPATACRVAHALGCHKAGALDINIACSGFLYGVITSAAQIGSGMARRVLCIGGDTLSRVTNWDDRRTAVLFGDAAGAAVLTGEGDGRLLGWDFGADGAGAASLMIKAGPGIHSDNPNDYKVEMEGQAVFRFATSMMAKSSERALAMAGFGWSDIDLIVPHQANRRILEMAAKRWSLNLDRFVMNVDRYGNTSAGSIPLALWEAQQEGRIHPGSLVLLTGFGGGLSWASVVLRWSGAQAS